MSDLRIIQSLEPEEFIEALKPHDDSFMALTFGSLLEYMDQEHIRVHELEDAPRPLLFAMYRGDSLL